LSVKSLQIWELRPGMKVAKDIYGRNGKLLFGEGVALTDQMIYRIEMYGIFTIPVNLPDGDAAPDLPPPPAKVQTFAGKVKSTPRFKVLSAQQNNSTKTLKNTMLNAMAHPEAGLNVERMCDSVRVLARSYKGLGGSVANLLSTMRDKDDETFDHSMNVALLCSAFADWLSYGEADKDLLILCGLYHDIGKLKMGRELLAKKEKLSAMEYETLKTHTTQGYAMLREMDVDQKIKQAALSHHERADGSGYPYGLRDKETPESAKIVAICDVYEAMTAPRVYRPALCPFEAIELFEDDGYQKFNTGLLMTFCENISSIYLNARVVLSDGREGEIKRINASELSKPLVMVGSEFLDLSRARSIKISQVVN